MANKRNELNIKVDYFDPHIIGITESWAITDISDAKLGITRYVMFRKDGIGRRGGGVILYIKESIQAYNINIIKKDPLKDVSKRDYSIWGNFNYGHIQWKSLQNTDEVRFKCIKA